MYLLGLAFKNIIHRRMPSVLMVVLITLGVSIIYVIHDAERQSQSYFTRQIDGVDLVVGAKGSPLQILLSAVYQIDAPTGNIDLSEAYPLSKNKMVDKAIPLAYGDSYRQFRVVGTDLQYADVFHLKINRGRWYHHPLEVVLGHEVATQTGLRIGDTFEGNHGIGEATTEHAHSSLYRVVGILSPNTVAAHRLILTSVHSVWDVHSEVGEESHNEEEHDAHDHHSHEEHHDDHHDHDHDHHPILTPNLWNDLTAQEIDEHQLTAVLITFKNRWATLHLPRHIQTETKMMAVLPAVEINKMFEFLGQGLQLFGAISWIIIGLAGLVLFVFFYTMSHERQPEMTLLRLLGMKRYSLSLLISVEAILITTIGYICGYLLGKVGWIVISKWIMGEGFSNLHQVFVLNQYDLRIFLLVIVMGLIGATLPSISVYKASGTPRMD